MNSQFDLDLIKEYGYNAGLAVALLLLIFLVLYLIDYFIKRLKMRLMNLNLKSLKIFGLEVINVGKQELIITSVINTLQVLISIAFLYFSLVVILSEIPATEGIATELVNLIFEPLEVLFNSFLGYLPRLFNIIITILIAHYLIKSVNYISKGVIEGNFRFPGFHPRTAKTTSSIIKTLIYVLTIIVIIPNMPRSESFAFKGIATFLGALITIGGSSVIANYMAGIVITYMHAFEKGDWVDIDGISGKITNIGTFAIRLDSYKEEAINIPNSKVLSTAIRNYSGKNKQQMILHTEVSIGYDVAWKKVQSLLIQAANNTGLLSKERSPFVLQKKLDDFYVVYELNAILEDPSVKPKAYSALHANILDVFNEAGIEIMSPHYQAERDGTSSTIASIEKNPTHDKKD